MAIATVVTVAEILKNSGLAIEKRKCGANPPSCYTASTRLHIQVGLLVCKPLDFYNALKCFVCFRTRPTVHVTFVLCPVFVQCGISETIWHSRLSLWSTGQTSVCHVAEIITSTVDMRDESRGRPIQKAKVRGCNPYALWSLLCCV